MAKKAEKGGELILGIASPDDFGAALRGARIMLSSQDADLKYVGALNPAVLFDGAAFVGHSDGDLFPAAASEKLTNPAIAWTASCGVHGRCADTAGRMSSRFFAHWCGRRQTIPDRRHAGRGAGDRGRSERGRGLGCARCSLPGWRWPGAWWGGRRKCG